MSINNNNSKVTNPHYINPLHNTKHDDLLDFDHTTKSKKLDNKNYAPIDPRLATLSKEDRIIDLAAQRTKRLAKQAKHDEVTLPQAASDYCPKVTTSAIKIKREKRENARKYYARRHRNQQNMSPYLDLTKTMLHTIKERFALYNRHHKCIHGRTYNVMTTEDDEQGKPVLLIPSCDHHLETINPILLEKPCRTCGRTRLHEVKRQQCGCDEIEYCDFCRNTYYICHIEDAEDIISTSCVRNTEMKIFNCDTDLTLDDLHIATTPKLPKLTIEEIGAGPEIKGKDIPKIWSNKTKLFVETTPRNHSTSSKAVWHRMERVEHRSIIKYPNTTWKDLDSPVNIRRDESPIGTPIDLIVTFGKQARQQFTNTKPQMGAVQSAAASLKHWIIDLFDSIVQKLSGYSILKNMYDQINSVVGYICKPFYFLATLIKNIFHYLKKDPESLLSIVFQIERLITADSYMTAGMHLVTIHTILRLLQKNAHYKVALLKTYKHYTRYSTSTENNELDEDEVLEQADALSEEYISYWGRFSNWIGTWISPKSESGETYLAVFINWLYSYVPTVMRPRKAFEKLASFAGDFNKIFTGSKNLGSLMGMFFSFLPNFIKRFFQITDPDLSFAKEIADPETPLHKVACLSTLINFEAGDSDQYVIKKHLATEAMTAAKEHITKNYNYVTDKMQKTLDRWTALINKPYSGPNSYDPIVLTISGDSGVGKSTIWPIFASVLYPESTKEIRKKTFTRNIDSVYFDGLIPEKHPILLYDDFCQKRSEVDLAELIAICTCSDYMPNFARIDTHNAEVMAPTKGSIYQPELIVLLSNTTTFNPTTLTSAEAVNRRLGFHINMSFKEKGKRTPQNDFTHARFRLYDSKKTPTEQDTKEYTINELQDLFETYILNQRKSAEKAEVEVNTHMRKNTKVQTRRQTFGEKITDTARNIRDKYWVSPPNTKEDVYCPKHHEPMPCVSCYEAHIEATIAKQNKNLAQLKKQHEPDMYDSDQEQPKTYASATKKSIPKQLNISTLKTEYDSDEEIERMQKKISTTKRRMDAIIKPGTKNRLSAEDVEAIMKIEKENADEDTDDTVETKTESGFVDEAYKLLSIAFAASFAPTAITTIYTTLAANTMQIFIAETPLSLKIAYGVGTACCLLATAFALKKIFTPTTAEIQSGETSTPKAIPMKTICQSGEMDLNLYRIIKPNLVYLQVKHNGIIYFNQAIFVHGNIIMFNEHFLYINNKDSKYMPKDTIIEIFDPMVVQKKYHEIKFDPESVFPLAGKNKDMVLYQLPVIIPPRKSITKHFCDGSNDLTNREALLITILKPEIDIVIHHTEVLKQQFATQYDISPYGRTTTYRTTDSFVYKYKSAVGDCGSPIAVRLPDRWALVGVHQSGGSIFEGQAYGMLITKQMIQETLDRITEERGIIMTRSEDFPYEEVEVVTTIKENGTAVMRSSKGRPRYEHIIQHTGSIRPIAVTKLAIHAPNTTALAPSPIFDRVFKHTTEPAILNDNDPRVKNYELGSQLENGMNKYSQSYLQFDEELVELAGDSIAQELCEVQSRAPKRVLTQDESINGVPGIPYMEGLNMKPSAGYPFVLNNKLKGPKRELFSFDPKTQKYTPSHPLLIKVLADTTSEYEQGIINTDQYIDTIKDERRPLNKIHKGRLFAAAPVSQTILSRQYFLPFCAHMYATRLRHFSAVGINKGSREWHYLIKRLLEVGNHCAAGDYSRWDGTLMALCFFAALEIIEKWYASNGDKEGVRKVKHIRRAIIAKNCFCYHRAYDFIYEVIGGIPSGTDLTVIINTIVNELYLRVCWMCLVPSQYKDLMWYRKYVRTAIYGDDNLINVDQFFISYFNAILISQYLSQYAITLTPASKSGEFAESADLKQCTFLKNATGEFHSLFVPHMEYDALIEIINWIRPIKGISDDQLCEDNCNSMLMNLFFYGRARFNEVRDKILAIKPSYKLLVFTYLEQEFLQHGIMADPNNDYGFTKTQRFVPVLEHNIFPDEFNYGSTNSNANLSN